MTREEFMYKFEEMMEEFDFEDSLQLKKLNVSKIFEDIELNFEMKISNIKAILHVNLFLKDDVEEDEINVSIETKQGNVYEFYMNLEDKHFINVQKVKIEESILKCIKKCFSEYGFENKYICNFDKNVTFYLDNEDHVMMDIKDDMFDLIDNKLTTFLYNFVELLQFDIQHYDGGKIYPLIDYATFLIEVCNCIHIIENGNNYYTLDEEIK